jgi:type IV pilus assembly protein PilY1
MNALRYPIHLLAISLAAWLPLAAQALNLADKPLFLASSDPRVLLVASRDHQLSIKAYTDYSDLNGDGVLDTTYNDSIAYYGYFDSKKCYSYTNERYEPAAAVTSGTHQCNGSTWSGNFLNWASMTRMDILRKTLYGGYRSTDSTTETVLERHFLPVDVHAFVKVYNPDSADTLKLYIPSSVVGTNKAISLCNVSDSTNTHETGTSDFTMPVPLIKVAAGSWPQWASSEVTQCAVNIGNGTQPTALLGTAYNARVKVCDSTGGAEENCKTYPNGSVKPTGLLQKYGDIDAERSVRFGLMTGSYAKNKSGGVLRKNISRITNNNAATSSADCSTTSSTTTVNGNANDEINVCSGQFIRQGASDAGIINTFNRLHIAGFKYTSGGRNDWYAYNCNRDSPYSQLQGFTDGQCVDWGSPLSEIYLEALRYFSNAGVTSDFNADDSSILASLPQVTWSDPLPATEWCALSNIVVLSTGLNSFDTDQLASFTPASGSAVDAATLTNTVGDASHENINGKSYLIGGSGSTVNNQCTAKTVDNLATAKGLCPELPYAQGGYGIAGLAYAPKTIDLRPGYATQRAARWGGATPINKAWADRQPLNTYAVQLAESLPRFNVAVGSGSVTLLPSCQSIPTTPGAWTKDSTGWHNCTMTDLIVDKNVAMADVGTSIDKTCSGNGSTSRCFTIPWDGFPWGADYDMDGIQRLGYCVGSACDTFKMLCPSTGSATNVIGPFFASTSPNVSISSDQIVIATCATQAAAGHTLTFGYTVTGTSADGAYYPIYRPGGGNNFNTGEALPSAVTAPSSTVTAVSSYTGSSFPVTARFTQSGTSANLLQNPLWYAAKYGAFTDTNNNQKPDLTAEWDAVNNATGAPGADGIPDNYFDVKNPANLITALSAIFDAASQPEASASAVATNSTTVKTESRVYQAKFSAADWSGQLLQYKLNDLTTAEWDTGSKTTDKLKLNEQTPTSRVIITKGASDGVPFRWNSLTGGQQSDLNKNAAGTTDSLGSNRVDYLRGTEVTGFRTRTSKLGDIVNSNPLYVGPPAAGYSDVDHAGYSAFRNSNKARTPMVYVGGNDGMVHGVNAALDFSTYTAGVPVTDAGKEVLAYVPSMVFANLSRLTDPKYNQIQNHRYFVDGSPMAADAYLNNAWTSVLIGGLGAGGRGFYALDITNPSNFTEANAASLLLWEFTQANDTDMGFAFNHPPAHDSGQAKQIVKMANGKWAVIVGNGYNSDSGKAALFILFIEDGIDGDWVGGYKKIVVDAGPDNGLSTPIPVDSDGDGLVDTVYAGDLKGNLWKFLVGPGAGTDSGTDAVTSDTATWRPAFSAVNCTTCTPLFSAKDSGNTAQPITWPPEVALNPQGGKVVLFGTGKYLGDQDGGSTDSQTFYGIYDKGAPVSGRSELTPRIIDTKVVSGNTFRVSKAGCGDSPLTACPTTSNGWYADLPTSGERMTGIPKLASKKIIFNTFIPSGGACSSGGTGWLMSLDYLTGGQPATRVFDTNSDTKINNEDEIVAGIQIGAALAGSTLIRNTKAGEPDVAVSSLASSKLQADIGDFFGSEPSGRVSWREIVQ